MTLKAFAVTEECDNTGAILFADRNIEARKRGADEFNGGELRGMSCRRAPWADGYSDKPLPASLMIDHGWQFECSGCGETIDLDWLADNDLPVGGVIGTQHSTVFCSEICQARENLRQAIKRDHERRAIAELKAYVRKRFPKVVIRKDGNNAPRAYATTTGEVWQVEEVVVSFDFPGMKIAPAQCSIRRRGETRDMIGPVKPYFTCCAGDREAFEAWAASAESRKP